MALRQVAKARGLAMTELASRLDITRQGLYHALSEKGNPELSSLTAILDALGFKIAIEPKHQAN
jgi:probable addiction module antidote protein